MDVGVGGLGSKGVNQSVEIAGSDILIG